MATIDTFIQNEITPHGIVSFEFIKTIEASNAAMLAWGHFGKTATGISLGLDFLYIILYTVMICTFLSTTSGKATLKNVLLAKTLLFSAYLFPLVGLFDVVENYSLIQLLLGSQSTLWPTTAYYSAIAKFSGTAIALSLIICGQVYVKFKAAYNR